MSSWKVAKESIKEKLINTKKDENNDKTTIWEKKNTEEKKDCGEKD